MGQRATASPPRGRGGASRRAPCSRPVPLPLPPLQHRGQLPRVLHRPARPARSREPRIPAPPPLRAQLGSRRLRADLGERRGGSPPPTATACLRAPFHASESAHQALRTQLPEGRGGAGREVGEPGGGGGGARGAQLEPAFLLPGVKPSSPDVLLCLLLCTPEAVQVRPLGFLEHFGAPRLPSSEF